MAMVMVIARLWDGDEYTVCVRLYASISVTVAIAGMVR